VLIRFLERLIPIEAGHEARQFPYLFGQDGHIGKFTEIANSNRPDPLINVLLCLLYCHNIILGEFLQYSMILAVIPTRSRSL
jgi:hypothetical protein